MTSFACPRAAGTAGWKAGCEEIAGRSTEHQLPCSSDIQPNACEEQDVAVLSRVLAAFTVIEHCYKHKIPGILVLTLHLAPCTLHRPVEELPCCSSSGERKAFTPLQVVSVHYFTGSE